MPVERALISVSDKSGITEFAAGLKRMGVEIISTGGTAGVLKENGMDVVMVSDLTGFPEMLDGRVKTLHPAVHGGILARRTEEHLSQIKAQGIRPIDMVVVNLYPFESTIKKEGVSLDEAVENIDIGGPTLLRSAAKNHESVAVISNPERYQSVLEELKNNGDISPETRKKLALEAFQHTASYDIAISNYLHRQFLPEQRYPDLFLAGYELVQELRYGENWHQNAAFYRDRDAIEASVSTAKQLHGKQLSYNNILDINDAFELVRDFDEPAAAAIKHTNPCGAAVGENITDAYRRAFAVDPMSAYGGIIALNRPMTYEIALMTKGIFLEATIAPGYEEKALERLRKKKNLRILETPPITGRPEERNEIRSVVGGLLVQNRNTRRVTADDLTMVSERRPTEKEIEDMLFAFAVTKHTKSNSIIFAKDKVTVGIGAGQMSRVDAVKIAGEKSMGRSQGAVMASDAFFPFRDGIDEAHKVGITAVIQPGGSIRDQEVLDAVNEYGMAMVYTGIRAFKH